MNLLVTDRSGRAHELEAAPGGSLMELLRDKGLDVEGTCGGQASCASCHIYVSQDWIARLPEPGAEERAVIDGLLEIEPGSRLACQIALSDALDDIEIKIAPEF